MTLRLLVLSDLHLEVGALELPDPGAFDVAVLAGDIDCRPAALAEWVRGSAVLQRAQAIVLVPGNHEYYDGELHARAAALRAAVAPMRPPHVPPLHLLDEAEAVIGGVRFLGCTLWTDFALRIDTEQGPRSDPARGMETARRVLADYRAIALREPTAAGVDSIRRLQPQDTVELHQRQRAWLAAALQRPHPGPTVVVTHHGSHRGSLASQFAANWASTAYSSELPDAFFEVPSLWVHGHTHSSHDYRVGGCRIVCNPRGYQPPGSARSENRAFDPTLVVTVD